MTDSSLKRRTFYFGPSADYHLHLTEGKRGRWRWSILTAAGKTIALSPVRGWDTEDEARANAAAFFGALGVELVEGT